VINRFDVEICPILLELIGKPAHIEKRKVCYKETVKSSNFLKYNPYIKEILLSNIYF